MKRSSTLTAHSLAFASVLIFMGPDAIHAQLIGGHSTPGQGSSIIGQPPIGQSGTTPIKPNYPNAGLMNGTDPVKDKLNRANREAADIDRDGRISPEEASRMPPGTPLQPR
ncbi:MAG: hypothetical protein ABI363_05250 [Nitrosospira sp.]